eukprot:GFKZ01007961.1.p1 GENE.GFKZ01007961.1~~GFKZ01007961.1.p1  ORF type:complete len:1496 (-),score=199.40 GFKZ01007961.1:396-4883(-)
MQPSIIPPYSSSLAQVVCDWSPSNLADLAKKFADFSSSPQVSFSSYDSYRNYFEPLLLAEVSAELLSVTEKYHQRHTPLRNPKVRARREEPGSTVALVSVQKVTKVHTAGFGWTVDIESHDRKGPVGCVDSDVVVCWPATPQSLLPHQRHSLSAPKHNVTQSQRNIPPTATLAVVTRTTKRSGCRLVLSRFPDGNDRGLRTDLEEGEENEDEPPALRLWNVLRLTSLTTMRREFDALRNIKTSPLMPTLLRPSIQPNPESHTPSAYLSSKESASSQSGNPATASKLRNEQWIAHVILSKANLNTSQSRAIAYSCTSRKGFSLIQGPPGTGKTSTLRALLNVIHMTQYQTYYESLLESLQLMHNKNSQEKDSGSKPSTQSSEKSKSQDERRSESSFLGNMMLQMNKTVSTAREKPSSPSIRARRPRLLVCAASNAAVDEILTRLTTRKFIDGQGREYCPELARIGAGDKVSDSAKPFTAEGQAEAFLDRLCAEDMNEEARKSAQMAFLSTWQTKCNSLLAHLARLPKGEASSRPMIIDLHEKLERMDRDLRRLSIAASDGKKALTREEKLRRIARTYVEDAQLVFATLSGSASSILTKNGSNDVPGQEEALFDTVLIDEAAQATETSTLIPLTLGASQCILVGDPQQLPATVLSSGSAGVAYGQSLLERISRGGQLVLMLDTQYRMHPAISSFPRRHFYNGRLVDDDSVQGENRAKPYHRDAIMPKLGPYVFLDISEGEESRSKDDKSIFNRTEAELASLIYTKLKKEYSSDSVFSAAGKQPGSSVGFGVVTPYKRQMQELRQSFDRAGIPTGDVEVDTVDSYQGREKDVIVFSCVRTSAVNRGIGFVRDVRRMNVGLTRARSSLIVLGSAQALSEGSSDWADLVEDANSRGCLISVSNIQRCLYPAPASGASGQILQSDVETSGSKPIQAPQRQIIATTPIRNHAAAPSRVTHNPHYADPRRRAAKRAPAQDAGANSYAVINEIANRGGVTPLRHHNSEPIVAGNPVGSEDNNFRADRVLPEGSEHPAARNDGPNGAANTNSLEGNNETLQSTLAQVSGLLSQAGFVNTAAVEDTLREHVKGGGSLDLEVVMAAAIANNGSKASEPNRREEPGRPVPSAISAVTGAQGASSSMNGESDTSTAAATPVRSSDKKISSDGSFKSRGNPVRDRGTKPNGRDQNHDKRRDREMVGAPSGWDMLFAAKGTPKQAGAVGKQGQIKDEAQTHDTTKRTSQAEASASKTAGSSNIVSKPTEEAKESLSSPADGKTPVTGEQERAKRREHGRKPWNENGGEIDRRRSRPNEFGSGSRNHNRGERGRKRGKRARGRGGVAATGPAESYPASDGWNGHAQFDPGFMQYQAIGAGLEPGIGMAPHGMGGMPFMTPQAMQPQAMQVQYQQHPFHQHAFQQQMQQQAMQQHEAMRQNPHALMQMPGMPPGMHPSQYQVGEFDRGYNPGMGQGMAPRSGNWGREGGGGRGTHGGRGRGRMKYGNRSRRGG